MKVQLNSYVDKIYVANCLDFSFTIGMNSSADKAQFQTILSQFNPTSDMSDRMLALFSAAITFDDAIITENAIAKALELRISREQLYEVILQSYLFLGFPRMLQAADVLQKVLPVEKMIYLNLIFYRRILFLNGIKREKMFAGKYITKNMNFSKKEF